MWSEDFLVLGDCFLSELKDKITCYRNEIRIGEFSENPDELKNADVLKVCNQNIFETIFFLLNDIQKKFSFNIV